MYLHNEAQHKTIPMVDASSVETKGRRLWKKVDAL